MMVSYSTDTAYGVMYADSDRSRVLTPAGQAYQQIEAAGIVAGTDVPELAHRFLDYVLSVDVQQMIPTTNWMFPVNAETPLPEAWEEYAVIPSNPVRLDEQLIEENEERWLREWARRNHGPPRSSRSPRAAVFDSECGGEWGAAGAVCGLGRRWLAALLLLPAAAPSHPHLLFARRHSRCWKVCEHHREAPRIPSLGLSSC